MTTLDPMNDLPEGRFFAALLSIFILVCVGLAAIGVIRIVSELLKLIF